MSIKLEHVSYTYMPGTPYEKEALKDVSLEIKKGEFVAIIGHTGSGKSTLVQNLNGLLHPSKGFASLDGINLADKTKEAKAARSRIGMVFQYPEHQLFAETVYEDIAFGPKNLGLDHDAIDVRVQDAMKFVGLDFETFAGRSPFSLSGGQMRRVAIAGVVALNPDYLILDEPSAGLDPGSRNAVFAEIMALYKKRGITIIMVTHSMEDAAQFAKRMLVIYQGKVIIDGKPGEVFLKEKDRLLEAGMDIPEVYKLADALRARGMRLPSEITDAKTLLAEIKKRKGLK
ncbi:MAG: energy-coupling factor transporter ATPase [Acidaminococcaceae bacterium]|nr:energy-coupling factor transporter ATPase [Acidaminococcaceae bacterium]MBQ8491344.1 energy-coupling factor transporter ATPase [Acidaminococcaceae bacterium]MBQ9255537.1 energy-coupling factor transporter ATPase [Acidaminococcaceae bacterium]MBQ9320295.1 energy-coupling factor transporter ATPase [Acidaminococcaceae bacterium]MBR1512255.1 energy-coupling factor transporter ATPase [Acidaminococcaceae bacterium]